MYCAIPAAAETLTLERALSLAEGANPRLRAAQAQAEGARSGVRTASAFPNPEVEALTGRERLRAGNTGPEGTVNSLGLTQRIDLPSVREPRIRAAQAGVEGSRHALDDTRLAVRAAVKHAYFDVLRRQAERQVAIDNSKLLADIRRRVEVRVNAGEAARLELTRADAEALVAANTATSAGLRVGQALAVLRTAIGAPLPAELELSGNLSAVPPLPPLPALRDALLANHPALAQSRADVKRSEARLETERALRTPQPALRAGVEQMAGTSMFVVGIGVPLPLWDRRDGPIGEALAAQDEAKANGERRRLELLGALDDAYGRFQIASQSVQAYEGGILKQAEAALRVAEAAYRFGERGFIEVLDAQRVLRTARLEALAARYEQQSALVALEQLRALNDRD